MPDTPPASRARRSARAAAAAERTVRSRGDAAGGGSAAGMRASPGGKGRAVEGWRCRRWWRCHRIMKWSRLGEILKIIGSNCQPGASTVAIKPLSHITQCQVQTPLEHLQGDSITSVGNLSQCLFPPQSHILRPCVGGLCSPTPVCLPSLLRVPLGDGS